MSEVGIPIFKKKSFSERVQNVSLALVDPSYRCKCDEYFGNVSREIREFFEKTLDKDLTFESILKNIDRKLPNGELPDGILAEIQFVAIYMYFFMRMEKKSSNEFFDLLDKEYKMSDTILEKIIFQYRNMIAKATM